MRRRAAVGISATFLHLRMADSSPQGIQRNTKKERFTMTTPVIITLIICGTLIVLSAISNINEALNRKHAEKNSFFNIFNKENKK